MSENILPFTPPANASAQNVVQAFVDHCKGDLWAMQSEFDWNDNYWPGRFGINFGDIRHSGRILNSRYVYEQPFLDICKAFVFYEVATRGAKNGAANVNAAMKALYQALRESKKSFWEINVSTLDSARDVLVKKYKPSAAYSYGKILEKVIKFAVSKGMVAVPVQWDLGLCPPKQAFRVGERARKERETKMPDRNAVMALGKIFASDPKDPRDIISTCVCLILLSAPTRIGEALLLQADCEVMDAMRDGEPAYGLRYHVEKDGISHVKWIPTGMADLVHEAIRRLRCLGEKARKIALWHEQNPRRFFRHSNCPDVSETEPLSYKQVALAMGWTIASDRQTRGVLYNAGLPSREGDLNLEALGRHVYSRLPEGFPWIDQKAGVRYSDGLFCYQAFQFHSGIPTSPVLITRVTNAMIGGDLCTRYDDAGRLIPGIFDRHGYNKDRLVPLKITTHQFRSQISTIASSGMMSPEDIAWWSGRANTRENDHYVHHSEREMLEMIRAQDPSLQAGTALQDIVRVVSEKVPMTREQFYEITAQAAHMTDLGFCTHDYVMAPCQRYLDCVNCNEHLYIKGDSRICLMRERRDSLQFLLSKSEDEMAAGTAGVDRWHEANRREHERLSALIQVMEDDFVPDGTVVFLNATLEYSPLRRALSSIGGGQIEAVGRSISRDCSDEGGQHG